MPLFRFHRGSLKESLQTTIIVKTFNDMVKAIVTSLELSDYIAKAKWGASFSVKPYPSEGNNFDERIGWFTHIVTANMYEQNKMHPIGFLSEPLE
jgi:hypothetical protein